MKQKLNKLTKITKRFSVKAVVLKRWLYTLLNNITLWFVGKYDENKKDFEIQGIFLTRKMAIKACRSRHYFILPLKLNKNLSDKRVVCTETYYPIQ